MDIIDTVIRNIKNELKQCGMSQNKFAEKMGYGTVHMSNMMRGQKKGGVDTFSFLEKAAEVLNVPVARLLPLDESASQYTYIKDAEGDFAVTAFKTDWLAQFSSDELFVMSMLDESMLPTIKLGDLLLVIKRDINRDGIYIFKHGENIAVRRVTIQLNNQITINADNSLIPSTVMHRNELKATLLGQVIWLGREL